MKDYHNAIRIEDHDLISAYLLGKKESMKQEREKIINECLDDLPMESNPENPGSFNEGYNWCLQLVTRMLAVKRK